jgi:ATP-dependent exoDNAse (exonuclease V) alpha subunit
MVGTRTLAKILEAAGTAGAKVVLVGDHRQIPEIDAGGAFAALARRSLSAELEHNRRQVDSWERTALDELRAGNVDVALDSYQRHGRIHQEANAADARLSMVGGWLEARNSGIDARMVAARRTDIDGLNRLARADLKSRRQLGDDIAVGAGRGFALSDEVMCLHNDRRLGVRNGTRGEVIGGGDDFVVIATGDGDRRLDRDYLDAGWLDHGYATTIHKAQGQTVERAFVLGTAGLFREAAYVAMSRARTRTDLYVVAGTFAIGNTLNVDPLSELRRLVSTSRAKHLASDAAGAWGAASGDRGAQGTVGHMEDELGRRPDRAADVIAWEHAASSLADYRKHFEVNAPTGLGPRPTERGQRPAFDAALAAVVAWQRRRYGVDLEPTGLGRGLGR